VARVGRRRHESGKDAHDSVSGFHRDCASGGTLGLARQIPIRLLLLRLSRPGQALAPLEKTRGLRDDAVVEEY
jgi:hypothetical protein